MQNDIHLTVTSDFCYIIYHYLFTYTVWVMAHLVKTFFTILQSVHSSSLFQSI